MIISVVSLSTTALGICVFIVKRFRRCKFGCIELECSGQHVEPTAVNGPIETLETV